MLIVNYPNLRRNTGNKLLEKFSIHNKGKEKSYFFAQVLKFKATIERIGRRDFKAVQGC